MLGRRLQGSFIFGTEGKVKATSLPDGSIIQFNVYIEQRQRSKKKYLLPYSLSFSVNEPLHSEVP